jgi:hypothetical protein
MFRLGENFKWILQHNVVPMNGVVSVIIEHYGVVVNIPVS